MKTKHVFLTSGMIMAIATFPAISEENYYNSDIANSCQVDFLGGTGADNSTAPNSFQAQYTANEYTVSAGQYLAANGITGTLCPANSFCPGGEYTFSETNDQGMTSCPSGFTLSVAGTSDENNCYHECTASDIENGAKVATITGGTVTKGGVNTCDAECTTGYTFKAAQAGSNPLSGKENIATGSDFYISYGLDSEHCQRYPGVTGCSDSQFSGMSAGDWSIRFSHGTIKGRALCSTQGGIGPLDKDVSNASQISTADSLTPETGTGRNCWCKITGYTPSGSSTLQSLSSLWGFYYAYDDASACANKCANACAYTVQQTLRSSTMLRSALYGAVDASSPAACVANTINVTWNPANGNASTTNQCTYDGAITLPDAPEKRGYTFKGWKLQQQLLQ